MKRIIFKTSFFTAPFILLYLLCVLFYSDTEKPDLLRLGLIPNVYRDYYQNFYFYQNEKFDKLSKQTKKKYQLLIIGDSFSGQRGWGYRNLLAENFDVLYVDRFISKNQIQTLINFSNGDFFDVYKVDFVILQNIERNVIHNIENIKLNGRVSLSEIDSIILADKGARSEEYQFFSQITVKFPLYYFPRFYLQKNYLSNNLVYNLELNTNSLFSNGSNKLLFYYSDLIATGKNNNKDKVDSLNMVLNAISHKLSQRGIKLIFLPSPDKYDFYYEFISEKNRCPKPLFFHLMGEVEKDYIYINSKEILTSKMEKDMYFYDDTHWSPIASKIIAAEIKERLIKLMGS